MVTMTDAETAENTELDAQSESDARSESDEAIPSINEEDAEAKASADYQKRMDEWDNVDASKPITTVPETGESGTVEMPKS